MKVHETSLCNVCNFMGIFNYFKIKKNISFNFRDNFPQVVVGPSTEGEGSHGTNLSATHSKKLSLPSSY